MRTTFSSIFSDRYLNHGAVADNAVLLGMYRLAYPFAVVLDKLRLTPNQITTQSLVFAVLAFLALVYANSWGWFALFWGASVLLDFCDGTVARMTNRVSRSAFRYDHMSDLFKIFLLFLGVSLRYSDPLVHVFAFCASFVFMYSDAVNNTAGAQRQGAARARELSNGEQESPAAGKRFRDRFRMASWLANHRMPLRVCVNTYSALFTINGHTLLLFFILPLGRRFALFGCAYATLIGLWTISLRTRELLTMRRV